MKLRHDSIYNILPNWHHKAFRRINYNRAVRYYNSMKAQISPTAIFPLLHTPAILTFTLRIFTNNFFNSQNNGMSNHQINIVTSTPSKMKKSAAHFPRPACFSCGHSVSISISLFASTIVIYRGKLKVHQPVGH